MPKLDIYCEKNQNLKWAYVCEVYGENKCRKIGEKFNIVDDSKFLLIIALRNIPKWDVKKGDIGGFVKTPSHLPQETMIVGFGVLIQNI